MHKEPRSQAQSLIRVWERETEIFHTRVRVTSRPVPTRIGLGLRVLGFGYPGSRSRTPYLFYLLLPLITKEILL